MNSKTPITDAAALAARLPDENAVDPLAELVSVSRRMESERNEAVALIREVVRGGNTNTLALRTAILKASRSWMKQARTLLDRVN